MSDAGIILKREKHIAVIVLNRSERDNAMNEAMWQALDDTVAVLERGSCRGSWWSREAGSGPFAPAWMSTRATRKSRG
jgi:hypothetical protein